MRVKNLFYFLFSLPLIINAQLNDRWVNADSTELHRWRHTATLLSDGRVLVTGGFPPEDTILAYSSCEIYDPQINKWAQVSPMNIARFNHRAVLLDNGKVLVAGGATNDYTTNKCEIYDPVTDEWQMVSSMNEKRENHLMLKLKNGKILVSGGGNFDMVSGYVSNTCEIYDPTTDEWEYVSPMNNAMDRHDGVVLTNGNVIVGGAELFWGGDGAHYELYDVTNDSWSILPSPILDHGTMPSLNILNNGNVFVVGDTTISEIYNPDTDTWYIADTMNFEERHYSTIKLNSGRILVLGKSENCEIYDPIANSFEKGALKPYQKEFTLTKLQNGNILLTGGIDSTGITNKSFIYFPDTTLVGIKTNSGELPTEFYLYQNYPNPFNPTTTIKYSVPTSSPLAKGRTEEGFVTLKVYDVLGREITTLVNEKQSPGIYTVTFNAKSSASGLPSGIYFYQLRAGSFVQTRKMILMK